VSGTDIRTATTVDLLTGLPAQDADAVALATALDLEIQTLAATAANCALLSRVASLTSAECDAVAGWFGLVQLEGWGLSSVERKRAVLLEMVEVYQRRGTIWAWERMVEILETPASWDAGAAVWDGGAAVWDSRDGMYTLTEWWEQTPLDPAYTYRVDATIEHRGLTLAEIRHLREVLDAYIPARAELYELSETITIESELVCAGYPELGLHMEVYP